MKNVQDMTTEESLISKNLGLGDKFPISKEFQEWAAGAGTKTLPEMLRRTVDEYGDCNYLGTRSGDEYIFKTYNEIYQEVIFFACALLDLGCQPGDRVANFSNNCLEWPVVDFGTTHVGCVHVPMYATLSQGEFAYIAKDCGAKVLFVLTKEQLHKVLAVESELPELQHIITPVLPDGVHSTKQLWSWKEFLSYGRIHLNRHQARIEEIVNSLRTSDVASIIYTSGTTGDPKGVMLMHGNFCSQIDCLKPIVDLQHSDVHLSFLPWAHVFERIFFYFVTTVGASIGLAQSLISVLQDMQTLKPTTFTSVPALYSKIYERAAARMTGFKSKPYHWALKVGRSYNANKRLGRVDRAGRILHTITRKMLFNDVLKKTGGRIRIIISGGAPLPADVCEFFLNIGFNLREGYGLTETSPVICVNRINNIRPGSVGEVIPGIQAMIAPDGELLTKGPHVMRGYFKRPEATAEAIDSEGWFHTGDVGYIDNGSVFLTDRKKNLLVLSNGKNVAPAQIEAVLVKSEWIDKVVLVGNNRSCVGAIVVPNFEKLSDWCEKNKIEVSSEQEMVEHSAVQELIRGEINRACEPLSPYEKVKRFYLSPRDFSFSMGELTPTQKIKRREVEKNFAEGIEKMFN
ncbi:MAG: long-chain fatty acid--CoA ligase [bacterium]|nr:long-chain fatty acid--CoA ligase [bacterium]